MLMFSFRIDGKPEDVLNPKRKQLEKITPVCGSDFQCFLLWTCGSSFTFGVITVICTLSIRLFNHLAQLKCWVIY